MGGETQQATLAGGTGQRLAGNVVRLVIRENTELHYRNLDFPEPPPPRSIRPIEEGRLLDSYTTGSLVNDGWVYLFWVLPSRSRGSYVRIEGEYEVLSDGGYRQYATWDDNILKDERPGGKKRKAIRVMWSGSGEFYAFCSPIQLSSQRLQTYRRDPSLVKRRGHLVTADNLRVVDAKKRVYEADVDNHLRLAEYCHEKFDTELDSYNELVADEDAAAERLLVRLTAAVVGNYDQHDRFLKLDVTRFLENVEDADWEMHKDLVVARDKAEFWAGATARWMKSGEIRAARDDHWMGGDATRSAWVEFEGGVARDLFQTARGKDYLRWMSFDPQSLYNKLVAGAQPDAGEYSFKVARRGVKTINAAADYLINWTLMQLGTSRNLVHAYRRLLPSVFEVFSIPVDEVAVRFITEKKTIRGTLNDLGKLRLEKYEGFLTVKLAEKTRRALPAIVGLVEAINLYYVIRTERSDSRIESWQYYLQVGAAVSYSVSALQGFQKSGSRAYKAFRFIGFVGAIVDTVAMGLGLYRAVESDEDVRAIGYGISAIGTVMMFAGPASVVGAVGIMLYLVGFTILTLVTSTPLEKWIKKCRWHPDHAGKNRKARYRRSSRVKTHLRELLHILGKPEVKVRQLGDTLQISVTPSFFVEHETKFKVECDIVCFTNRGGVRSFDEKFECPGPDCRIERSAEGTVSTITYALSLTNEQQTYLKEGTPLYATRIRPRFMEYWNEYDADAYEDDGEIMK